MKRSLALLLTSLLLVFSLAACGKDQQPGGVDGSGSVTGGDTAGNGGDVTGNGSTTGNDGAGTGNAAGTSVTGGVNGGASGSMMEGAMDTMEDMGNTARNVVRGTGDTLTGSANGRNQMNGYTYDQMVQNGRVF